MVKEHAKKRTFVAVNEAKKHKNLARGYGSGARHSFGKGAGRFNSKGGFEGSYKCRLRTAHEVRQLPSSWTLAQGVPSPQPPGWKERQGSWRPSSGGRRS